MFPPSFEQRAQPELNLLMSEGMSAGCEQLIPTTAMKNRDVGAAAFHFRLSRSNAPRGSVSLCNRCELNSTTDTADA
jgi:hypothetical protein